MNLTPQDVRDAKEAVVKAAMLHVQHRRAATQVVADTRAAGGQPDARMVDALLGPSVGLLDAAADQLLAVRAAWAEQNRGASCQE